MAGGRPTKWTPELQERICLHLRYGATRKIAAASEGIAERTMAYWVEKPAFLQAVERAEAEARTQKLALLHQAAQRGSWQAAAWLLERLEPQAFTRPQEVRHTGPSGGALEVRHTYEPERPQRVFDILHEAGIVALGAGAAPGADDAAP